MNPAAPSPRLYILREFLPLLLALAGLQAYFRWHVPTFWARDNLLDLAQQISVNAVLAFGMTFAILIRGIDLSVGAVLALSGTASVWAAVRFGASPALSLIVALLAGFGVALAAGLFNGALSALTNIPAFIVTLASMQIARGLAYQFTDAKPLPIPDSCNAYLYLGNGKLFGVLPMPVVIMLGVFAFGSYLLHATVFGRRLFAIGGNPEAARYAGIAMARHQIIVYAISALCAAVSGFIQTAQLYSAVPSSGFGFELNAIAAAVVGRASLAGGACSMPGTLAGALIIGTLDKGLNQTGVHFSLQYVVKGAVILAAVFVDAMKRRR